MSVRGDVRDALAAVVEALALPGVAVRKRKLPALVEGDPDAVVCVAVGEARYERATADADAAWWGYYSASATLVTRTALKLADGTTDEDWLQLVRRAVTIAALNAAGAAEVDEVTPTRRAPFDPGLVDSALNWSAAVFEVRTLEPR